MKVSVIVPVYNVEPYLRKCLDSLVNQTLSELEILVVNDGSPDNSQAIIDEYAAKYPKRVKSFIKENGGQASARNMALNFATGEFIGFVDSDDWVDTDMYEKMYKSAVENGSEIVICNTVDHFSNYDIYHKQSDVGKLRKSGSVCNKLFNREIIGEARFPYGLWYEDFCFGIKLLMLTDKISYCEEHFYHALVRDGSTMNNNNTLKNLDIITVIDDITEFLNEKNLTEKYAYDLEYMVLEHILITSINRVACQKTPERSKTIKIMRKYVLSKYNRFWYDDAFKEFDTNHKIVAVFNALGLWQIPLIIFKVKGRLRGQ